MPDTKEQAGQTQERRAPSPGRSERESRPSVNAPQPAERPLRSHLRIGDIRESWARFRDNEKSR
jgi:hypothetical protein